MCFLTIGAALKWKNLLRKQILSFKIAPILGAILGILFPSRSVLVVRKNNSVLPTPLLDTSVILTVASPPMLLRYHWIIKTKHYKNIRFSRQHTVDRFITKTCLYNFEPLKPQFYIEKLGFSGNKLFFLYLHKNINCWYSLGLPHRGGSNEYPQSILWADIWKISEFFTLRKHAYSDILKILSPKKPENFQIKISDVFHISAQNIDCGYSLEPPRRGGSNEYPQSMFWAEIRKIMYTPVNPNFTI